MTVWRQKRYQFRDLTANVSLVKHDRYETKPLTFEKKKLCTIFVTLQGWMQIVVITSIKHIYLLKILSHVFHAAKRVQL